MDTDDVDQSFPSDHSETDLAEARSMLDADPFYAETRKYLAEVRSMLELDAETADFKVTPEFPDAETVKFNPVVELKRLSENDMHCKRKFSGF